MKWTILKVNLQNVEPTKHVANCDLGRVQHHYWNGSHCLQWISAALWWFSASKLQNFHLLLLGETVQQTVDISCSTLNLTNHTASKNQARVERGWQTVQAWFQLHGLQNGEHAAGLPNFLLWKSLFTCHCLQYFKNQILQLSTRLPPSAKLALWWQTCKDSGKRNLIFNQSALE